MSSMWACDVETEIYSIVKARATANLITEYPNINFTMKAKVEDDAIFPTVYIHFLPSLEVGQDIENTQINAIRATAQVEITVGGNQNDMTDARKVAYTVLDEFKRLRFNITSMPEFRDSTNDTQRIIYRASRVIGSNDKIN